MHLCVYHLGDISPHVQELYWLSPMTLSADNNYSHTRIVGIWPTLEDIRIPESSELGEARSPLEKKNIFCAQSPADRRGSCSQIFHRRVIFAIAFHLRPCKGILSFWGWFKWNWGNCCRQGPTPVRRKSGGASHFSSQFNSDDSCA